tara:strand:+ start:147 stop:467 length:321 start_codon:yes stop_codon:yes gene_type:complete
MRIYKEKIIFIDIIMEKTIKNSMTADALTALSVVCNHTTLPIVKQQQKRIQDLEKRMKKYYKICEDLLNLKEWCESYGYDEDYDREAIDNGEETLFRPAEEYDEDD